MLREPAALTYVTMYATSISLEAAGLLARLAGSSGGTPSLGYSLQIVCNVSSRSILLVAWMSIALLIDASTSTISIGMTFGAGYLFASVGLAIVGVKRGPILGLFGSALQGTIEGASLPASVLRSVRSSAWRSSRPRLTIVMPSPDRWFLSRSMLVYSNIAISFPFAALLASTIPTYRATILQGATALNTAGVLFLTLWLDPALSQRIELSESVPSAIGGILLGRFVALALVAPCVLSLAAFVLS